MKCNHEHVVPLTLFLNTGLMVIYSAQYIEVYCFQILQIFHRNRNQLKVAISGIFIYTGTQNFWPQQAACLRQQALGSVHY